MIKLINVEYNRKCPPSWSKMTTDASLVAAWLIESLCHSPICWVLLLIPFSLLLFFQDLSCSRMIPRRKPRASPRGATRFRRSRRGLTVLRRRNYMLLLWWLCRKRRRTMISKSKSSWAPLKRWFRSQETPGTNKRRSPTQGDATPWATITEGK